MNNIEIELESINKKIRSLESYKSYFIDEMETNKMKIIGSAVSASIIMIVGPIVLLSIGLSSGIISLVAGAITAGLTNALLEESKIRKSRKHINEANEQIYYLEKTKKQMQEEVEKLNTININYINKKYNWRNKIKFMTTYSVLYKKIIRHFKKGDLKEYLYDNYYEDDEIEYLFNRVQEEIENKQKKKQKNLMRGK